MKHTKQEIKNIFLNNKGYLNSLMLKHEGGKHHKDLYNWILKQKTFTDNIAEKIYCILNDINNRPMCIGCGCELNFHMFKYGYFKTCNKNKCKRTNTEWKSCGIKQKENFNNKKTNFFSTYKNKTSQHSLVEIKEYISKRVKETNNGVNGRWVNTYKNKDILHSILYITENIIPINPKNPKWAERFYYIYHDITTLPVCIICNNPTPFINFKQGYQKTCSVKCSNNGYAGIKRVENHISNIIQNITEYEIEINNEFKGLNKNKLQLTCKNCNKTFLKDCSNARWKKIKCPYCMASISNDEKEISNLLKSFNVEFIQNTRNIITPLELDFYIPSKSVAIEYNGNYWHCENMGKDKNYHLSKTLKCMEHNIRLIHIFEDEWIYKQQIVKARLKHILGKTKYKIYGRKCIIKEIDVKTKNKFLNKYHIQGEDKSRIKLGAFYNGHLIAVMTFGKRKITGAKKLEWELIRYATVANFNCIGVAGKLLKHFERNYTPEKIITYADRRWSQGNMYKQLGFQLSHISPPNYWYVYKNDSLVRYHRFNFRKNVLSHKLKKYDSNLTEWQNMQNNQWNRIWDCGNYVFEWNKKEENR